MADTNKYMDTLGNFQTVNIDPSGNIIITVHDETVPIEITIQGPTYGTTYRHVGGRPKDRS